MGVVCASRRISDLRSKEKIRTLAKKGAEFLPLPFGFNLYSYLEKLSYKILADFLGTAQRLTVDHENGNRFCATERN